MHERLVSTAEKRLAEGGLLALLGGVALRCLLWYALTRSNPMLDTQLVAGGFLLAAINVAGVFIPRAYAGVPMLLGALGWLYGLSLLPRYLRWLWKTGSEAPLAPWLVWTALGVAAASFILRWYMNRRWSSEIYGKGWAWIDNWAQEKSLRARVLASKALVALGYRRARLAGDEPEG